MARRPQPQFRFGVGVGVPVVVVDHHNDALRPFFHALSRKMLPHTGVRMLHFDSHPDLQVMALGGSALHAQIAANQYNPPDVLKHSRIYSWIMPMVLAGALSEVWWFSGAFCGQIDVGTYHLVVGLCKQSGLMKVAAADPRDAEAYDCRNYFASGRGWAARAALRHARPFTLRVRRCTAAGGLAPGEMEEVQSALRTGDWWLDIDEDFFSCSNPYVRQLETFLPAEDVPTLRVLYSHLETPHDYSCAQAIVEKGLYRLEDGPYFAHKAVQHLGDLLGAPRKWQLLRSFRDLLRRCYPKKAPGELIGVADLFPPAQLHDAALQCLLPHHISPAAEIATLLNTVFVILAALPRPPLVTVALSNSDGFLPDAQATAIHAAVLKGLKQRYATDNVTRVGDLPGGDPAAGPRP
eukprot:EG_transcript_9403